MGWIKNTLIFASFLTAFLFPKIAKAIGVDGFFIDAPDCSTKVWRVSPPDTLKTKTDSWGCWLVGTENFSPQAEIGDTLYVEGGWNLGGKAKTMGIVKASGNKLYDLHLNKFTANIKEVEDTSNISVPLNCVYWIGNFPPETTEVDTGGQGLDHYFDGHFPFDTMQATQAAAGTLKLEKVDNDTAYSTTVPFIVDRSRFHAQLVTDTTVYFPIDKEEVTGIEEQMTDFSARTIEDVVNLGVRLDFKTNQTGIIDIDKNGKDLTRIITEPNKVNYTFVDRNVEEGRNYNYQAVFKDDTLNATAYVPYVVFKVEPTITNGKVKISGAKEVDVYDLSGRKVAEYSNKNSSSTGTYDFDVPQGIYFLKTKGSSEETKKVVKLK